MPIQNYGSTGTGIRRANYSPYLDQPDQVAPPSYPAQPTSMAMGGADDPGYSGYAYSYPGAPNRTPTGSFQPNTQTDDINRMWRDNRTYAIDQGDSLAATVQGFSAAEIDQQCIAFAPTMRDFAASLPSAKPEIETADLRKFVVGTGVAPAQLSANARICLGVGYRTDNADVALASAMVLVGLGETSYAELVGEHLVYGYGTPTRIDTGLDWLETAVGALENGATPLVTTSSDERVSLLESALTMLSVGATKGTMVQDASAPAQPKPLALPVPASATVPAGPSN